LLAVYDSALSGGTSSESSGLGGGRKLPGGSGGDLRRKKNSEKERLRRHRSPSLGEKTLRGRRKELKKGYKKNRLPGGYVKKTMHKRVIHRGLECYRGLLVIETFKGKREADVFDMKIRSQEVCKKKPRGGKARTSQIGRDGGTLSVDKRHQRT